MRGLSHSALEIQETLLIIFPRNPQETLEILLKIKVFFECFYFKENYVTISYFHLDTQCLFLYLTANPTPLEILIKWISNMIIESLSLEVLLP